MALTNLAGQFDSAFLAAVETVLRHEGGYVDNPADRGGATKFGISQRSYPHLDIANLTRDEAVAIYHRDYWTRHRYGELIHVDVAIKTFDLSVNMGPANAHRILQRAVNWATGTGLVVDGIIGSKTIAATNQAEAERVLQLMRWYAAEYYHQLVKRKRDQLPFLLGWLNRAYA